MKPSTQTKSKTLYETVGDEYKPVAEDVSGYYRDSLPFGDYALRVRPGSVNLCPVGKSAYLDVLAVAEALRDTMMSAMYDACSALKNDGVQLDAEELAAYQLLYKRRSIQVFKGVSMRDVVDAGIDALLSQLKKDLGESRVPYEEMQDHL
jgi:hypothetical protein